MIKIAMCIPGNNFSGVFFDNLNNVLFDCKQKQIECTIHRSYCNDVYEVRNKCLGGDLSKGPEQLPFQGKEDYDFIIWIDSDIIFKPQQLYQLMYHNKSVVSGVYLMADRKFSTIVEEWDIDFFLKHGFFPFMEPSTIEIKGMLHGVKSLFAELADKHDKDMTDIEKQFISYMMIKNVENIPEHVVNWCKEYYNYNEQEPKIQLTQIKHNITPALFPVVYAGFGFLLIKKGILEQIQYPWFAPKMHNIGVTHDFSSEDVSLCLQFQEKNIPVYVDGACKVGHMKNFVI